MAEKEYNKDEIQERMNDYVLAAYADAHYSNHQTREANEATFAHIEGDIGKLGLAALKEEYKAQGKDARRINWGEVINTHANVYEAEFQKLMVEDAHGILPFGDGVKKYFDSSYRGMTIGDLAEKASEFTQAQSDFEHAKSGDEAKGAWERKEGLKNFALDYSMLQKAKLDYMRMQVAPMIAEKNAEGHDENLERRLAA